MDFYIHENPFQPIQSSWSCISCDLMATNAHKLVTTHNMGILETSFDARLGSHFVNGRDRLCFSSFFVIGGCETRFNYCLPWFLHGWRAPTTQVIRTPILIPSYKVLNILGPNVARPNMYWTPERRFLTNNETDKRRNLLFVLLHLFLWKVQTDVPRRNANQKRLLAG